LKSPLGYSTDSPIANLTQPGFSPGLRSYVVNLAVAYASGQYKLHELRRDV